MSINGQNRSKNWTTMKGKPKPPTGQKDLFGMRLENTLDQHVTRSPTFRIEGGRHVLHLLANAIDWDSLDGSSSALYSKTGQPSHPVRRRADHRPPQILLRAGRCMLKGPFEASINLKMATVA